MTQPAAIHAYDTLSKSVKKLVPRVPGQFQLFVCGPTVYDYAHLGHGKTYTQFDFIARYLRYRGYEVDYLLNITDIDDKIIRRAHENNIGWQELARTFEDDFLRDMAALGNTAVSRTARATDYIPQIVDQVTTLQEKGHAYRSSDGIYFEVATFKDYGKLSGRVSIAENDAVSRVDDAPDKRGWNDFCLWKDAKPGEPTWETKLGSGRPGWHIEDTAITATEFGPQYDLHGGAIDLIFPHHEAEITQMEAASGKAPLVNCWLHGGFLNIGNQKMSKSLGNFTTIRSALATYDVRALRYLFLSVHYRSELNITSDSIDQAAATLRRLDEFAFRINVGHEDDGATVARVTGLMDTVHDALDHDFNTPLALAAVHEFVRAQNASGIAGRHVAAAWRALNGFWGFLAEPAGAIGSRNDGDAEIETLIAQREKARLAGDYATADAVRETLLAKGIQLYDTPEGPRWRRG